MTCYLRDFRIDKGNPMKKFLSCMCAILTFTGTPGFAEPARTLIRNAALIVSVDPQLGNLENADVLIVGEKIEAIGKGIKDQHATIVDATGKIIMPGFVDVHNHLWQSLIRGCGSDKELLDWLTECVYVMGDGIIDEGSAYAGVKLSTLDLISTGVTTVLDDSHSFTPEFVRGNLRALEESGLRFVYAYCGSADEATQNDIRNVKRERIDTNPLARFQVCSHPSPAMTQGLNAMAKLAKELNVPLNVHLLENIKQRADNPMRLLDNAHAFDGQLFVNHAVHLTAPEIRRLSRADTRVSHNPMSNMRLASGIAPLPALHTAGLHIGLGFDGGANDTSDAFANMRAAVGLQRAKSLRADIYPTPADAIRLATLGGAEALGLDKEIGSLTPGKQADLIMIDPHQVNFAPRWDWLSQIVFNGQPGNVVAVWVNGRQLKAPGAAGSQVHTQSVDAAERAVRKINAQLGRN